MSVERLTIPDVRIDQNTISRSIIDAEKVKECAMEIYWRLKALEDAVAEEDSEEYDIDRLRELVEADRDGRCIVTPYRIPGDAYINHDDVTLYKRMLGGEMTEIEVSELYVSEDGTCDFEPVGEGHDGVVYGLKDMGITIFTEVTDEVQK